MKGRDGFVLISVIFITGLLAVSTTAFVANVRSHTLFARATLYNHQLEAAADGIARLTALQFATREVSRPFPVQLACRWDKDITVRYAIQDQAGLVDLNTANPELLVSLLRGLGKSEADTNVIALAISDYKDPDVVTSDGGPEIASYRDNATGPSNGPFATIEELDRIPVIDDTLYKSLLPLVTVHSQQIGFDASQAPPSLIKALYTAGSDQQTRFASPSPARVYSIAVSATRQNGSAFTRTTIVSLTGQPDKPFATLKWSVSRSEKQESPAPSPKESCFENIDSGI